MRVDSGDFPFVEVVVSIGTWSLIESAYVDTGFEGGLLMPAELLREVDAAPDRVPLRLPDGAIMRAPAWRGTVQLGDRSFTTDVAALGFRFLLGRQITDQLLVCFEYGRRVTITHPD